MRAEILSYSRSRGAFAGISLSGSTVRPDNDANERIYGKKVAAKAIVLGGAVQPTADAQQLLSVLTNHSPKNLSK
jgi:lipid-binding SYLF domain-containing protein